MCYVRNNNIEIYNPSPPLSPAVVIVWPPRQCVVTLTRSCRRSPLLLAPTSGCCLRWRRQRWWRQWCIYIVLILSRYLLVTASGGGWCTSLPLRDGRSTLGTVHEHARDQHPVDEPPTRRHNAGQPRTPHL